jgi:L-fucose mutarotase/ribose pyranase (RbsD/FucU family)
MLKKLDPLLNADLLHALASMGHGDELAIVDAHFPAASMARRLVRIDGAGAPEVLAACLSLMPLDTFVDRPANRMELVHAPDEVPDVARIFSAPSTLRKASMSRLARSSATCSTSGRNGPTRSWPPESGGPMGAC